MQLVLEDGAIDSLKTVKVVGWSRYYFSTTFELAYGSSEVRSAEAVQITPVTAAFKVDLDLKAKKAAEAKAITMGKEATLAQGKE